MTINFGVRTSKIQGNKKTISSLSLILILAISMIMVFAQPASAQIGVPQPEKTTTHISVAPTLVGVGQTATVSLFIYPIPTNYAYVGFFDGYRGVTVTFTRPDGTKDTFMPKHGLGIYDPGQTESLGAIYFYYEPNQAGNWSVTATMPAQDLTDVSGTVQMLGSTSAPAYFEVQTDIVLAGLLNGYPWAPLPNPNVFWSYPINSNNREWYQISGDWLSQSSFGGIVNHATKRNWQPYGSGPETGHIVWRQRLRQGGLMGGDFGSLSYGVQGTKEMAYTSVILAGRLYNNIPRNVPGGLGSFAPTSALFQCVDLATGELLFTAEGGVTAGIHLPMNEFMQSGLSPTGNVVLATSFGNSINPYLYNRAGSRWTWYNPENGAEVASMANCSNAYLVDGSELAFGTRGARPNEKLFRWNMTSVIGQDWPTGIEWEITLPQSQLNSLENYPGARAVDAKSLKGITADLSTVVVQAGPQQFWGYNAETGVRIWETIIDYPTTGNQQVVLYPEDLFIILDSTNSRFKAYSMKTGALQFTTDSFGDATWATTWTVYASSVADNEHLYAQFPDGTARAYSLADGHEVWRSTPIPSTEYTNNVIPFVQGPIILCDGKLYLIGGYSSSYKINPIPRHGMLVCIDATNGDIVFTQNGGHRPSAAANGYVLTISDYDGYIYAFNKGPTKTTVTAQQQLDGSALIHGSVIDTSPAAQEYGSQVMFANGVPAVADEDMNELMDYLYFQNATLLNDPPTPDGVTVSIAALDSNGAFTDCGTTTSDYAGQFAISWTPPAEGLYKIFATFSGSDSYYSSYAETPLYVGEAPAVTPTNGGTGAEPVDNTMLLYGILVAVIIAIVLALIAILRKK